MLIHSVLQIAKTETIALLAINDLLDNLNPNICQTISNVNNATIILQTVSKNEIYLNALADYVNQLPQFCLKYRNQNSYLILHAAMECLYNNF